MNWNLALVRRAKKEERGAKVLVISRSKLELAEKEEEYSNYREI